MTATEPATTATTNGKRAKVDKTEESTPDTLSDYSGPVFPTVKDPAGVERIVGAPTTEWVPAPIDPSDEAIKRAEDRVKKEEERSKAREEAFKTDSGTLSQPKDDDGNPLIPTVMSDSSGTAHPVTVV